MGNKHKLQSNIFLLLKHNRSGSYATRRGRRKILNMVADELYEGSYKLTDFKGLKQKHVRYLNGLWKEKNISPATVRNRNAVLRWVCVVLHRRDVVPSNEELNVPKRQYATNKNKSVDLASVDLSKVTNKHVLVQLHLQRTLGLRREESIKIRPYLADHGNYIELQPSWCKGGRGRIVSDLSDEARYWLDEAKKLVTSKTSSLIPDGMKYIQHRNLYDKQVQKAGIKHAHGLRHAYAQERYREITGWECPACGGPAMKELTGEQKEVDRLARMEISSLLGHSRIQIVINYLGR